MILIILIRYVSFFSFHCFVGGSWRAHRIALSLRLLGGVWGVDEETFRFGLGLSQDCLVTLHTSLRSHQSLLLLGQLTLHHCRVLRLALAHLKVAVKAAIVEELIVGGPLLRKLLQRGSLPAHCLRGSGKYGARRMFLVW